MNRINKEFKEIENKVKDSGSLKKKEALEAYLKGKPAAAMQGAGDFLKIKIR